jgi:hypothetical protein
MSERASCLADYLSYLLVQFGSIPSLNDEGRANFVRLQSSVRTYSAKDKPAHNRVS